MEIKFGYKNSWIDSIMHIFNKTEDMKRNNSMKVNLAFESSQEVATLWHGEKIIGFGRMITDYHINSAIFDVVVDPEFQKQGLGKKLMLALMSKAPETCFHLTSTFGKEAFYHKLGYRYHKTAMCSYPERLKGTPYLDWDREPAKMDI
jgi:GNAT superfamily N-acetyltransferase